MSRPIFTKFFEDPDGDYKHYMSQELRQQIRDEFGLLNQAHNTTYSTDEVKAFCTLVKHLRFDDEAVCDDLISHLNWCCRKSIASRPTIAQILGTMPDRVVLPGATELCAFAKYGDAPARALAGGGDFGFVTFPSKVPGEGDVERAIRSMTVYRDSVAGKESFLANKELVTDFCDKAIKFMRRFRTTANIQRNFEKRWNP